MRSLSANAALLCAGAALAAAAEPAKPGRTAASLMTAEEAGTLTRELLPKVEELRGLKFLKPVPVKLIDDEGARRHFKSRLDKFYPEELLRGEEQVYRDLGLLASDGNMVEAVFSLLEEQAGGYYDPDSDTFFVLADMPRSAGPMLIVHELTHALDDQHFSLDELFEKVKDDSDRSVVVGAVVEGSGSVVMTAYIVREMQAGRLDAAALRELAESEAGRGEKLKTAPPVLQRALLAPYMLGQTLTLRGDPMAIAKGVQPADIDRLFREPPVSTEQLLHPEKYWDPASREGPRAVALPDLSSILGEGWSRSSEGILGELTLALVCGAKNPSFDNLAATTPSAWTNECAAGWGGDQWHIYRNGGRHATLLATLWDTESDAAEFEAALQSAGRKARRQGSAVAIVLGEAGEAGARLEDEAMRRLQAVTSSSVRRSSPSPAR